ncbi:BT1 family-domain-containing protein [Chytriomyces sp. MP71]|nr:BT1 family-domain-containing protein [Chytriomyces sp. MP71]
MILQAARSVHNHLIVQPFRDLHGFLAHSVEQFSLSFMLIIGVTYFLQGFRGYAFGDGIIWFFSDIFGLDPGPTQLYMSTIYLTWNIKMLYGLAFDNFPLFGRKDKPWMVVSGVLSFFGFLALGAPVLTPNPDATTVWFFLALMGLAMSDVIADAMVVKEARRAGEVGGANLQSFCWILSSMGGIVGRPLAGFINGEDGSGSRVLLGGVYSALSLLGCAVTLLHRETRVKEGWSLARFGGQLTRLLQAIVGNRLVWLPMTWIVLNQAIVPEVSAAMNFWKKDVIDIGADKKAYIDTVGDMFGILGLVLYTRHFKRTPFALLFFWTQIAVALFALTDLVLVYRLNLAMGLSDEFFLIGSGTIINTLYSFQGMPFLVLAAQLCPKDIEATFYAAMMSLGNIGGNIGTLYGGYLLEALHVVRLSESGTDVAVTGVVAANGTSSAVREERYDFTNLPLVLWIRVVSMLASAVFVFWMVPNRPEEVASEAVKEGKGETEEEGESVNLVQTRMRGRSVGEAVMDEGEEDGELERGGASARLRVRSPAPKGVNKGDYFRVEDE